MIFTPLHSSSGGNLYRLDSPRGEPLLIECGLPIAKIKRAVNFELSRFAGCLVSHHHTDHAKGADDLTKMGIGVWCSSKTAEAMGLSGHNVHIMTTYTVNTIGGWRFMAFPTEHDAPGSLGFVVSDGTDKLLFATDTYFIRPRFKGLTVIAVECNWSEETLAPDLDPAIKRRLVGSHMSLATVRNFLKVQSLRRVREIHLLHLSDNNSDEVYFKREIERATGKPVLVAPK